MDVPKVRRALADPVGFLAEVERQETREAASLTAPGTGADAPALTSAGSLSTASTK